MASSFKESLANIQGNKTQTLSANIPVPMMLNPDTEPEITVDMDARTITVPNELKNIGVVSDHNAETVYIRIPSTTFDGIDLTDKTAFVEFINAGKEYDVYKITDVTVEGNSIKLGWTIDNRVTRYSGKVDFQLSFELDADYKWSTTPTNINVLGGLDIDSTIPKTETAVVSALFSRVNELASIVNHYITAIDDISYSNGALRTQIEKLQENVDYLKEHVVYILDDVE